MKNIYCKSIITFIALLFSVIFILGNKQSDSKGACYLSPDVVVAGKDGRFVYISMSTADYVAVFDTYSNKVVRKIHIPEKPSGLALSPVRPLLFVTGGEASGKVYVASLGTGKIISEIKVGHSPVAPVPSPDGKTLYVSSRFGNYVSEISVGGNSVVCNIPVPREPVASAITPDGKYLFVAHLLPGVPSDSGNVAASVSVINTVAKKSGNPIQLPNGSTDLHGMSMSPGGKFLYVTHQIAYYSLPTSQLERGWMNTNVVSIINVEKQDLLASVLLDDLDSGAANLRGITVSNNGNLLVVAHGGTNEISIIDRNALHEKLDRLNEGGQVSLVSKKTEDVQTDFSFLVGLRNRVSLKGIGPRGVTMAGGDIFVAEYFSGSLGIVAPQDAQCVLSVPLGKEQEISAQRQGEMLFNDATGCFQMWQSCASCHPDARMDGLNWDLLNDGAGNPKNVKSLLLSHKTPPTMGHGIRANAEVAVRSGFKYILFSTPQEKDAVAVDEYLKSLKPLPSPYLVNGELNDKAKIGKTLFGQVGCINCHSGPYFTNMRAYDVGTLRRWDKTKEKPPLDVPTLIEAWRTAPYLHDGRTMSVEEAFKSCFPEGVKGLSPEEIKALSEYVLSL